MSRHNLKLDAEAPRRWLMGGIADDAVRLGDEVGETVVGIDADVKHVLDAVAEACGGAVFETVHRLATREVGDDFLIVRSRVHRLVAGIEIGHFVDKFHATGKVDATVGA